MSSPMPALFLSHGAATLTVDCRQSAYQSLHALGVALRARKPTAILMISAHDVRSRFTVATAKTIPMLTDHPAANGREYVAPGDPALAEAVCARLSEAEFPVRRGTPALDHGAWVPLSLLFPDGDIPVVTLSLAAHQDPAIHLALGQALAPLRMRGVLILASGGATHSQRDFRQSYLAAEPSDHAESFSRRFDDWLVEIVAAPESRAEALLAAPSHPDFARAHPTLDHWLPVLIAAGAGQHDPATVLVRGFQHSLSMTTLGFGHDLSALMSPSSVDITRHS